VILHTETNLAPSVSSLERHHFHLQHGDFIRVDVTAINRAETNCSVTSDGVTVDLTDPKMLHLVDGDNLQHDIEYTVRILRDICVIFVVGNYYLKPGMAFVEIYSAVVIK